MAGPDPPAPRFLADHMLGTLTRWLRFLGYDTLSPEIRPGIDDDAELLRLAIADDRLLLTRDRDLAGRAGDGGLFVAPDDPDAQLDLVVRRLGLGDSSALSRCGMCNTPLLAASKAEIALLVPPGVLERQDSFWRCPGCGRVYWRGSHTRRILEQLADVVVVPPPD